MQLVDAAGAVVGAYGGGYATDSAVTGSGQGAAAPVVSTLLGQAGPVVTVRVAVDGGWLADRARVFPVTIDPSLSANTSAESGANFDTYTYSPFPTTAEGTFDTTPVLKVGTFDGGASVSRSYLNFDLTGLAGTVSEAHVTANNSYSFSCSSTPPGLTLSGLASPFSRSGTTWNNQPAPDGGAVSSATFSYGYSSACPGRNVDLDATALAGRWAAGAANNGVVLFTNEANSFGWKKFTSGAAGAATAPTLSITYSTDCTVYPQTGFSVCGAIRDHYNALGGPGGLLGYPTANELLRPDGVGKRQYFQHGYIYWSPATGAFEIAGPIFTRWAAQGWELGPLGYPVTDERAATTSFNGAGDRQNDFQHGSIYLNHLNGVTNNQTNPALLVGDKPFFGYDTINLTDRLTAKVNRGTGNLGLSLTALTVPGVAADRQVGLTYSALAQAPGSSVQGSGVTDVHGGWRVRDNPDIRIGPGPGYADYLDSSFAVWRFVGNGPTYTAPAGLDADLTRNADNTYRLKVHASAQTLTFDAQGTLTGDADRNNNTVSSPANAFATAITGTRGGGAGRTAVVSYNRPGARIGELCQSTTASNCTGNATRGPATLVVDYAYSAAGNLTGVTDANGHDTLFGYDTTNSDPGMRQNLTSVTDPTGVITRFTYDSMHRVTDVTRDATGLSATTTYDYITADQHTRVYDANHAHPTGVYVDDGIDATGKITDRTDQMGHHSSTTWTADNQVQTSTNASGGTSKNNYSQPGNAPAGQNGPESLAGVTGPMGATGTATYTNSAGSNALYAPTSTTDSMKNQSIYSYDGPGNLGSATNANAAAALVNHNIAGAFTDGTVSTTTDPNNVGASPARNTVYNYDGTHDLMSITPPGGDNTLAARSFSYDGFGRTLTRTTGRLTTTYHYDQAGRVTSQTHSDASAALSVSYDNDGNPKVSTDGTGTVTNTYSPRNQLTSAARTGTSPATTSYTYDLTGAMTGLTDGGGTTGYRYNKAGSSTRSTRSAAGRACSPTTPTTNAPTPGTTPPGRTGPPRPTTRPATPCWHRPVSPRTPAAPWTGATG